jgi:hypothetical protein
VSDLFRDILPSILETKKDVLNDPKDYNSFMVNRALSYHPDCLFHANQLNMLYQLDRRLQYLVFLNTIRAKRRPFVKWAKPIKEENLQAIKTYYGYSDKKAAEALGVLTEEQIDFIIDKTKIGE